MTAFSNCPKYINLRDLEPRTDRQPEVVYNKLSLAAEAKLPADVVQFILSRDTVFIGTSYVAKPETSEKYPSHVGMNHRGGLAGFVRVRNDGRTVVLPDYSGECNITTTLLSLMPSERESTHDVIGKY